MILQRLQNIWIFQVIDNTSDIDENQTQSEKKESSEPDVPYQ